MSYSAIVSRIKVRPQANAERLQLGTVANGNQVVVGLDTKDGELGAHMKIGHCLSFKFCGLAARGRAVRNFPDSFTGRTLARACARFASQH